MTAPEPRHVNGAWDRHVDHVGHDWLSLRTYLIERLPEDDQRAGSRGDYSHFSEPHTMEECPYAE